VADIDIHELVKFHKSHRNCITMTSVQPEGRFGSIRISENNIVQEFMEKPIGDSSWINGGFFVCEPEVFKYIIDDETTIFEREPLEQMAIHGKLHTYKHFGFWKPMDTLREKHQLEELIRTNKAPWIKWN
ncbi:MAG: sugar phosphate nucleotidyltransferase, partial [Clostridiales bacterium]